MEKQELCSDIIFALVKVQDDSAEVLRAIYRRIAFLTKAYREVMIMYYIDGYPTAKEICFIQRSL